MLLKGRQKRKSNGKDDYDTKMDKQQVIRHVFTTLIAHFPEEQEVRWYSAKEWICYAGTTRRATYVEKFKFEQNTKGVETNIPSMRTVDNQKNDWVCLLYLEPFVIVV